MIGGEILGNVHIDALEIEILPTARIRGNVTYRSPQKAAIHSDAVIGGDITFIQSEEPTHAIGFAMAAAGSVVLIMLIAFIVLGAAQVLVLPKISFNSATLGVVEPWKALGLGFAILVAAPFGIAILMSTVIGIPLGIVLVAVYLVIVAFGLVVSALAIGRRGLKFFGRNWDDRTWGRVGVVAIGMLVIAVLAMIPFLGVLVVVLALSLGIGALVVQLARGRAATSS